MLFLTLMLACFTAAAEVPYSEQIKQIQAPDAIARIGADLFGETVNLYTGSVEFRQVDVSLKGNNALPVAVGRRVGTGSSAPAATDRPFGQWDLDIPHVHGVFSARKGWTSEGAASNRCTTFGSPEGTSGTSNASFWDGDEFWAGNFLYVPGSGEQQMLLRDGANNRSPSWPAAPTLYPVVTRDFWSFSCLPSLKNASTIKKRTGEGFLAISPDGTKYQFDWMVEYQVPNLIKSLDSPSVAASLQIIGASDAAETEQIHVPTVDQNVVGVLARNDVWILPTRITDRFGNYVDYVYDTVVPENLMSITASDGRSLTLTYVPGATGPSRQIQTVSEVTSSGTRTWTYNYIKTGTFASEIELEKVTLPDASVLNLYEARSLFHQVHFSAPPGCDETSGGGGGLIGTMTHPSGATGIFTLTPTLHGRSNVVRDCRLSSPSGATVVEVNMRPRYFTTMSLTKKEITGPGLEPSAWSYDYGPANASWAPCNSPCASNKVVTVTDPSGDKTVHYFGNRIDETEGQLQQTDVYDGDTLLRSTYLTYQPPGNNPYPTILGYQTTSIGDADQLGRPAPLKRRVIRQQGVDFIYEVNEFDYFARAKDVTRKSTPGATRREITTFSDNHNKWLLGLVEKVSEYGTGVDMVYNTYNPTTSNLETTSKFGKLQQTFAYKTDGTILSSKDEKNQLTSFGSYVRGIPQLITFADGTNISRVVDSLGNIRSSTDQNLLMTGYQYDVMNRLTEIAPATGGAVTWNKTLIAYALVQSAENDLAAGHWRQTVSTGNGVEVVLFDALMRRVQSYKYDRNDEAATSRFSKTVFDINGNPVFNAFPVRNFSALGGGIRTEYDALGRTLAVRTDSELGALSSTNTYGANFTTTSSNNRNLSTASTFQTFDVPSEGAVASISAPEGVTVEITRDVFGKPQAVTRSGGGKSVTRRYIYDAKHRLCKTMEPETGSTIQDYDLANNVAWRATGLALPSVSCEREFVPPMKRISYGYDALNRLLKTSYGDMSPEITRSYWPDGLIKTNNSGGANWTYTYNNLRLSETETLAYATNTYTHTRSYDANASLTQLKYPDNSAVAYSPNALGEPTKVGAYATGVTYYPNGAIKGFTYGNGIVHSLTQNMRGLPERSSDAGVLNDVYAFDSNGNVQSILDAQQGVTNRTMTYDGLDRLKRVNAPAVWGDALYDYDALDNLTKSNLTGGPGIARTMVHQFDAANRLTGVIGTAGFAFNFGYDSQGNINQRGAQAFTFDLGNRMKSAAGRATYLYDGLGRRMSVVGTNGVNQVSVYSQSGQLLYTAPTGGAGTKYIYLHSHQIAEVKP